MKKIVFTGCSFTHAPDSWAHVSNPWIYTDESKDEIQKRNNSFTHVEFLETFQTIERYEQQYKIRCEKFGEEKSVNFKPENLLNGVKKLPKEEYQIHILASGGNSNIDNVRKIIHFYENDVDDIDTIIFQITVDNRANLFRDYALNDSRNFIYRAKDHAFWYTKHDDVWFEKMHRIKNGHEGPVLSIEALQHLVFFAKANNIKLKFFHGWDNFNGHSHFKYISKKYYRHVTPNLLTDSNIIDYAKTRLAPNDVFQHDDLHPSSVSQKLFWNEVVYPYLIK
tara:strand:- start:959 stop:1798 length:840 start_codon:yes stop_codon:yes gene_type:complete